MSKCLPMTLAALGVNKARFCLVCLSRSLEGPIHCTLRSHCSTSYKSHGGGSESCYCKLIILYYFHQRERGSPQAGLAEIWQGPRGELEKPFILACSSCCEHSKHCEEGPDQEQQPWNPVTFINLWLFLCCCSITSGYKLIFRTVQGELLVSYNSFTVSSKGMKRQEKWNLGYPYTDSMNFESTVITLKLFSNYYNFDWVLTLSIPCDKGGPKEGLSIAALRQRQIGTKAKGSLFIP